MKPAYSDYVGHVTRLYFTYSLPDLTSQADVDGWKAVDAVLAGADEAVKDALKAIYRREDIDSNTTVGRNLKLYARAKQKRETDLWVLLRTYEKRVAERRGLI